jgi:tRNA(fMet)-specific endonuclease VapC
MKYLLDANAVIALLNDTGSRMARRARRRRPGDVGISAIVAHQLYYGTFKSQRTERNVALVDALQFEVLDLDHENAKQAGEIRARLAARGTPIGPYDVPNCRPGQGAGLDSRDTKQSGICTRTRFTHRGLGTRARKKALSSVSLSMAARLE